MDRPITEEAQDDAFLLAVADLEGHPGGHRDVGSDDAVASEHVPLGIEEVHRPALAPGAAVGLAV